MRLQFRVWDKQRKEMLYDGFIVRHNNPPCQEWYDRQNEIWGGNLQRPEYMEYEAEPEEEPMSPAANDAISDIMEPECVGDATWALIDYANFYGQENFVTMQCTGFHDKDGELIWEGDLLEQDGIVDSVEKYYGHWTWNGQVITDFRDFDRYGNEITGQVNGPVTIQVDVQEIDGVIALGYQGEHWGLETKNLKKVGDKFTHNT